MVKLAKSFEQIRLPNGRVRILIDGEEFPWATKRGGISAEQIENGKGTWVTLSIYVDGDVILRR